MEKHVAQIFDRTKRIIEHARQECHLWEHNLFPKLILNGIPPPPWLCNSSIHSLPSDPIDLNNDDVSEVLLSKTQFRIPIPGHQRSLYSNLDAVSEDVQYPIGLRNEVHASKKDFETRDRLSNLPDCSVNEAGCASSCPPELESGAISPQNQMEPRVSESFHDPAMSLAKLQRSRSRQKALELRNSAKVSKRLSGYGDNAGDCTAAATGSVSPFIQEDHIKQLGLVNEFHPNNQSCLMEEVRREDSLPQKDHRSNYSSRITRSKSSSQKFNSLSAGSSSVEKEDGPPHNDLNEAMEPVNRSSFINGSCGVQEANIEEFQEKEVGSSAYDERLRRSSSEADHSSELLNIDRYKGVEVSDLKQPCSQTELTDLSKTSDCNSGSRKNTVNDVKLCQTKQETNIQSRLRLHRSSCPPPGDDNFFSSGGSVKSIDKSVQLPQPFISETLQAPSVAIVGSFSSPKEPHICSVKTNEHLSRSRSGKAYVTRNSKLSKSLNSNLHEQSDTCCESAGKKSPNVQPANLDPRRLSSSPNYSKLDTEISINSAEKENIAEVVASRNTNAVTRCTKERSSRPADFFSLDGRSLLAESLYIKTSVSERDLDIQENIVSGANPTDNAEHRSAATVGKVHVDISGLVENEPSCLGSRLATVNPNVEEDVSFLRLPSDFVMSMMPKQLVFDDGEETRKDGISSSDLKEEHQKISSDKKPQALSEPLDDDTQEIRADSFSEPVAENGLHRHTEKSIRNLTDMFPYGAPTDEVNADLAQQAPDTFSCGQNGDLSKQALLSNGKVTNFSTDTHNFKSYTESFTNDVEHSCSQQKRRKIEIETEKFLPDSTHLLQKQVDPIDQRPASGTSSIKGDNPEAVIEVQHLVFDQEDDIGHEHVSNSPTDVMEDTGESQKMEGSSCKLRNEEKLILDGSSRSSDTLMMEEANTFSFTIDPTIFPMDEKVGSWHLQVNSGQDNAEHMTCVERSTSSKRTYPGGDTEIQDGLSISPGFQDLDLIGTDEALPEFEGFIMQSDNEQSCTVQDQMELENMNFPRVMRSPSCYFSTPYKLHSLENSYRSLPTGLLEGYGLRASRHLNDGSPRSLSDGRPNCNGQYTSSVQTLWDRMNLHFGSSGNRKSLKPELPCINEENENVDEIVGSFQKGIGSEEMTGAITRGSQADIADNANPSISVLQDALASGREDFVSSECNFDETHNKGIKKLDKQDGNRKRFTSKGRGNQSISLGENGAKRNSESVRKGSSRPKLSGKDNMKQQRPTFSGGKSTRKNIVSNVTSFIPAVRQKQAAAVVTGKKVIRVKALEAAEAAKRDAEKKENERKMKKEEIELQKKKKEEERKKKEAEMTAKKRQRENEEKKEKERKRKRVNDMKQQELEKLHAKKEELKIHRRATGEEVHESRKIMDERDNRNNLQLQENRQGNVDKISETEPLTIMNSTNNKIKESCLEKSESVSKCADKGKETMIDLIKAVEDNDLILRNSLQEQSYEMSPYRSDDEDEDEDDIPNNKFIPSWASKHSLSLIVSSQKMDPETIFPRQSFCDIGKVLPPHKLHL